MDLKLFCSTSSYNHGRLAAPYSYGDYTYATNGHILIRVPRLADAPENENAPKVWTGDIAELFNREPAEWVPVPEVDYDGDECEVCGGTGTALLCPECEGEGEVFPETKYSIYEGQDCATCEGNGQISQQAWNDFVKGHKFKGQAIEDSCDECIGTGIESTKASQVINGSRISEKYLWMVGELPGAELGIFEPEAAVRFRFDGGDGLIMPMRGES
jgi:hypothetical protein